MLRVYFDTNVYDQIDKGRIPSAELDLLRSALKDGRLIGYLGIPVIEELLGQWETYPASVVRKLILARDLVGFDKILKAANTLLEEGIRAYATGSLQPSPFLPATQRELAINCLQRIAEGDEGLDGIVSGVVSEGKLLKQNTLDQWVKNRAEVHSALGPYSVVAGHPQRKDISWWLKSEELAYAEALAKPLGVDDACRSRGLHGLLEIRIVRAWVNALAAYIFDITIGRELQPRAPKWGDGYDLWHIISASTADAFVTYDGRLVELLNRLPIEGFSIFPSIRALLKAITPHKPPTRALNVQIKVSLHVNQDPAPNK